MSSTGAEARKISRPWHCLGAESADATRCVVFLIAAATLVRLALASAVGLGIDESYMVGVSRHFEWSYFDHPPVHVWLVGFWAKLFGESPVVVRLPFIALFAGSTWLMYRLTAIAYGDRAGLWAAICFNLAPAFTLSTASWVLPDGPMVFFLLLAAYLTLRTLQSESDPRAALLFALGAGAAGGLAMLSKYLAVFFFAGVGLYLLTSPRQRHWLLRREIWLSLLVAVAMFTPVVVWNAGNEFASFAFQSQRGVPASFSLKWFGQDVGGQLLYLLPWLAVPLAIAVYQGARGSHPYDRFFFWLSAPAILLFLALGFVTRILPHWPMAGWLFAFPLLGRAFAGYTNLNAARLHRAAMITAVLLLGFFAVGASQAAYGWIGRLVPMPKDPTLDLYNWSALAPALAERRLVPANGFVATPHWIETGKVNYALGGQVAVLCLCNDARHFAFINHEARHVGTDAVLLSRHADQLAGLAGRFEKFENLPDIVLTRAGQPAVTLKVARGTHLKPTP